MDSYQPTLVYESTASAPANSPSSLDVSRAQVDFIAGAAPQFSDETASLLRTRLLAAASLLSIVMGAAFLGNLAVGTTQLWLLRLAVWLALTLAASHLFRHPSLKLAQLRVLEVIVFGTVLIQFCAMLAVRFDTFIGQKDAPSLVATYHQFLNAWCVLIFLYGTLMPNHWQRGAALLIPTALVPYALVALLESFSPTARVLLAQNHAKSPLPMPLVAACIATYTAHVIHSVRREAYKARQFGQYRLLEKLGAGGMGEVYRAEHTLLKRPCALKLIRSSNESDQLAIARFEKEVKTTARLSHWNTIEIYDYGRTNDGTFYYVMELLPGMTLEELVGRHGPLPPERAVYFLKQICGALREAHAIGLIHRDIKPANIFASHRGGDYDVAKLLDFGLVKERTAANDAENDAGAFSGTPQYMSPEQATAYDEVDGRADLYALGGVAYFLLTGRTAFAGSNLLQLLAAHQNAEITPPSQYNPTIGPDLESIVMKCLAKSPADRFQDANELRQALDRCVFDPPWTPERAAAWWTEETPAPRVEPSAPTMTPDVTVDFQPRQG